MGAIVVVVKYHYRESQGPLCVCVTWVTWTGSPLPCWGPSVSAVVSVEPSSLMPVCMSKNTHQD